MRIYPELLFGYGGQMTEVGKEIKRMREGKGWSQAELAVYAGSSQPTVNQIESGKRNPSTATLVKLARALDVEVADFFPKAQAPLSFEDIADEEDRQGDVLEERRAQDFVQQHPHEEERAEFLAQIVSVHAHYNKLFRDQLAAARDKDMNVKGTATMWGFFFTQGLQSSLEKNNVIAYVNCVLQGRLEATSRDRQSCRNFVALLEAENAEATRLVDEVRDVAREQDSAAHEAELGILDIEAFLADALPRK
jgi:transcriptional regulator with XRE-family HTH domain